VHVISSGIDFRFTAQNKSIKTWFDSDFLEKIIINLLSNAFKFTSKGGEVKIDVTICAKSKNNELQNITTMPVAPEYICIAVSDTGKGIADKHINSIFERFYQIEEPDKLHHEGTGIGLALSKKLVELHHGAITVESKEGVGTTFRVYLPHGKNYLTKDEIMTKTEYVFSDIPANTEPAPSTPDKNKKNPLILIVEDNTEVRNYLVENLKKKYNIIEADNGKEGFELAKDNPPDLVLTDVMMPEMNGLEFCNKIKTNLKTSHIPVVIITARTTLEHKMEGLETGADAYITKPFNMSYVELVIRKQIESRRKLQKKFSKNLEIQPKEITCTTVDEKFVTKAIEIVEENMAETEFNVENFASQMGESRTQLYRKLKALTGLAPNEFVRNLRIKRAAQLLIQEKSTVGDVLYRVGFNNRSYFNRCFRQQFDLSPGEYLASKKS